MIPLNKTLNRQLKRRFKLKMAKAVISKIFLEVCQLMSSDLFLLLYLSTTTTLRANAFFPNYLPFQEGIHILRACSKTVSNTVKSPFQNKQKCLSYSPETKQNQTTYLHHNDGCLIPFHKIITLYCFIFLQKKHAWLYPTTTMILSLNWLCNLLFLDS